MNILITGTSKGIGRAIAEKFLACGHRVTGVDLLPASLSHPNYTHHIADIVSDSLPDAPFDILINNAGVQASGRDIEVNLKGTIRVTETYLSPAMKSVLFIASASATSGAEFPEYAASKGGVVSYMKNVALRMAAWGGTANSLSPGGVLTELNRPVTDDPEKWEKIMAETPLQKWATPDEIAEWAYFLTAINKSMTAQDVLVDNGEYARSNFIW